MRKTVKKCLSGIVLGTALVMSINSFAAPEMYSIDPSHSYVEWHINHLGFSEPSGKWFAEGTLQIDAAKPADSKVNVTINVKNIVTGLPKLDEHLNSVDFFDTAKFPTATFISDKVVPQGKDAAKVYGTLTLKGVSKQVVLKVKLNKEGVNPVNNKPSIGFSGTTEIKRSDFGISTLVPVLGDDIPLQIELEASKVNADKPQAPTVDAPKV